MQGTEVMNTVNARSARCWLHPEETSHPIWRCQSLLDMSAKERMETMQENRASFRCLGVGHLAQCRRSFKCCIDNCERPHHDLLHEAYVPGAVLHGNHINEPNVKSDFLLQIQKINCKRKDGRLDSVVLPCHLLHLERRSHSS